MSDRYDLIVFDWDGTLMDSTGAIASAIIAACHDLDLPPPTDAEARHVIGLGLVDALQHAVPALAPENYSKMVDRYRHHYLSGDQTLSLFPGIRELIESLDDAGKALAVATGKSRVGLDRALEHTGLRSFFDSTRCADECFSKPHPAMLDELMAELDVPPNRTLMVGDTTHDLLMARNAGVTGLAVAFGAHPRSSLESEMPLAIVDTPTALAEWLILNA